MFIIIIIIIIIICRFSLQGIPPQNCNPRNNLMHHSPCHIVFCNLETFYKTKNRDIMIKP